MIIEILLGNCSTFDDGVNGPNLLRLGFWLGTQRKLKKIGKLSADHDSRLQYLVNSGMMRWFKNDA